MNAGTVYTKVVETDVLGVKAYHVDCSCGYASRRYNMEESAARRAKDHARKAHGARRGTVNL